MNFVQRNQKGAGGCQGGKYGGGWSERNPKTPERVSENTLNIVKDCEIGQKDISSKSRINLQAIKMWRLYSIALGSIVVPPYLGYCKLFQVPAMIR